MQFKTMSFQIGLSGDPFESALRGLCAAFPDFVAVDWQTSEVALLQYPRQTMIDMNPKQGGKQYAHIRKELEKVESQYLLRELIARNSATLSAAYLEQLRRLQIRVINDRKTSHEITDNVEVLFYGESHNATDNQQDDRKTTNTNISLSLIEREIPKRERKRKYSKASIKGLGVSQPDDLDERFQKYLAKIQVNYPVLYSNYHRCKLLLREEYKTIAKYIAALPSEEGQQITGLVYNVHKEMNGNTEVIGEYSSVSGLLNKRLRRQGFPSISEMSTLLLMPPVEVS